MDAYLYHISSISHDTMAVQKGITVESAGSRAHDFESACTGSSSSPGNTHTLSGSHKPADDGPSRAPPLADVCLSHSATTCDLCLSSQQQGDVQILGTVEVELCKVVVQCPVSMQRKMTEKEGR